ncbi:unnamed protein product [Boreogadus saida]
MEHITQGVSTTTGNGVQTKTVQLRDKSPIVTSTLSGSSVAMEGQELRQICQDVGTLRAHLTALQKEGELQDVWCHVGYVLDFLLFRIYLLIISCYALVIIYMWCIWVAQT